LKPGEGVMVTRSTSLRVLVVEDNPDDMELARRELVLAGYEPDMRRVEEAEGLRSALASERWDVVLADYRLPAFSGMEAMRVVRESGLDLPLILVSGTIGEEAAVAAMKTGVNDYVLKDHMARLGPVVERELRENEERARRRAAEHALRTSEERLRLAMTAAGLGTWEWDLATGRIAWSQRTCELFGVAPEAFDGTLAFMLDRIPGDDRERVQQMLTAATELGKELRLEHRVTCSDSSTRWVEALGRLHRNADCQPERLAGIYLDITTRKQAEQQREVLARAEKLRGLGQMASGVAHDLNQSLALISGYVELARQAVEGRTPDLDKLREALDVVRNAAQDGGETVKRLLTFGRRQQEAVPGPVDMASLLREVAHLTAPRWRDQAQAEGRPISLYVEVNGRDGELTVIGDAVGLRESLTNLVFNAVDGLPHGGTLRLRGGREGGDVLVEVSDTGIGMSEEVKARIFEPFFTTKGEQGSGLGLAQVWATMDRHEGQVEVHSALGAGTTICLRLRAAALDAIPAETAPSAESSIGGLHILAVDDEPKLARMAAMLLRREGHVVETAGSGEEAIELLAGGFYDVVISDLGLGAGMSGWDLLEQARQRWPGTRLVLATGWGASIDECDARERGVAAVVAKPYLAEDLGRAVHEPEAATTLPAASAR
jgi:two-component system, cell cycle sensor histidine kinase and response regulator CckA